MPDDRRALQRLQDQDVDLNERRSQQAVEHQRQGMPCTSLTQVVTLSAHRLVQEPEANRTTQGDERDAA